MKSKVALAVAIALAIIAAIGIRAYIGQKERQFSGRQKNVYILVASKRIHKGTAISPDMLGEKAIPEDRVLDSRLILNTDHHKVNQRKVARTINAGEPLYWSDFPGRAESADPTTGLEAGYRAITVPVDKVTGCAGRLLPGTIIDVIAPVPIDPKLQTRQNKEPKMNIVLTKLRVLATDLNIQRPAAFLSAKHRREFAAYSTVTLHARPKEAVVLAYLAKEGTLHLVIRTPDDPAVTDTEQFKGVSKENLGEVLREIAKENADREAREKAARKKRD